MHIKRVDIQNFRKLKCCNIEFSEKETIFVGANNSGKTSAMHALIYFLDQDKQKNLTTNDFTLSNWKEINQIGKNWISSSYGKKPDLTRSIWEPFLPTIDVWLNIEEREIHYVRCLIPTLDWDGGFLGVRLVFEPTDLEEFFTDFINYYENSQNTIGPRIKTEDPSFSLWPEDMKDFLEREIKTYFKVKSYILDPSKYSDNIPQRISDNTNDLGTNPFKGLIKIDSIEAQRGFSDPNSKDDKFCGKERLSSQFKEYFCYHLDPANKPNSDDIKALRAIKDANISFDETLKSCFKPALNELQGLNYPGFSDPQIQILSKEKNTESLDHNPCVKFSFSQTEDSQDANFLSLPENYNGLGYQNLIHMVFKLIRFRDGWMRTGKAKKKEIDKAEFIEPLHLVLIEEPEAHLHTQVQQVFIKKAYDVLRFHPELNNKNRFTTQMVVSTHSSYIAHQIDFTCLRYFKRETAKKTCNVPCVSVVNLSEIFGNKTNTVRFATRYLKTTHCDLFFADGAIIIEGAAERMLLPMFIKKTSPDLDRCYISILEISGSHAHTLKDLIEKLSILTLIVTDIDSIQKNNRRKTQPETNKGYRTNNSTLKLWIPHEEMIDDLFDEKVKKISSNGFVRVAYQCPINISYNEKREIVMPYTFEDALVLTNLEMFRLMPQQKGLLNSMIKSSKKHPLNKVCESLYNQINKPTKKAEMALDLLFIENIDELIPPKYIKEGLEWLDEQLKRQCKEMV